MNVIIVDDDYLVTLSLVTIVKAGGIEVAATGSSGKEAALLYEKHKPDILLMDIRMEGQNGLEAAELILKKHKTARILFLTTFADDEYIIRALKLGAKGYILKQDYESIVPSLYAVKSGQTVFGQDITAKLPHMIEEKPGKTLAELGLSEKEQEIIALIAEGKSNKEIAAALFLGEGTVRNSVSLVLQKLELRDRTQLAVFYYKLKQHEV